MPTSSQLSKVNWMRIRELHSFLKVMSLPYYCLTHPQWWTIRGTAPRVLQTYS